MPADQLTALDATFLELEEADASAHMHIGGVMIFEPLPGGGTPAIEAVREQLEPRLGAMPRYRQRLSAPHRRAHLAELGARYGFDIAAHVRRAALPAPGGEAELLDWAAEFWSHRLDRGKPSGRWCCSTGSRTAAGRWRARPITAWSTASARSTSAHLLLDATPASARAAVARPVRASDDGAAPHADQAVRAALARPRRRRAPAPSR